ncbi:MAG: UDP-N-acetylmuramoyl-tripeptide--D-alanyl-D-alanine ligase [Granulosicoccus sp.]
MSFSMSLGECLAPLQGSLTGDDVPFSGVSIDTRTLQPGDLYVAIQGEQFNGHDFVTAACDAGAHAIMVHEDVNVSLPVLKVANTQIALGRLARHWAKRFKIPTIAITGSNGKTTVKEIVATILRQLGPVLSTKGNLNNEIGVPLTLLEMREDHLYAVIEMGANHAGEIARLVEIAEPDVAVINNIGTAHLEGFGSVEGIAKAKSEIFSRLTDNGYAVINADDNYADFMRGAAAHCRIREFGLKSNADVRGVPGAGLNIKTLGKTLSPRFRLSGDHNGMNALAAVAAVQCLDIQAVNIVRGLENVRAVPGRLEKKPGAQGALLIDDSYNANPDSAQSAVNVLTKYPGTRYLVLGDMAELGAEAESMHARIGAYARQQGIDGLWTIGPLSSAAQKGFAESPKVVVSLAGGVTGKQKSAQQSASSSNNAVQSAGAHFTDQELLIQDLRKYLAEGVTVLVKGSRSSRMERVVKGLLPSANSASAVVKPGSAMPERSS